MHMRKSIHSEHVYIIYRNVFIHLQNIYIYIVNMYIYIQIYRNKKYIYIYKHVYIYKNVEMPLKHCHTFLQTFVHQSGFTLRLRCLLCQTRTKRVIHGEQMAGLHLGQEAAPSSLKVGLVHANIALDQAPDAIAPLANQEVLGIDDVPCLIQSICVDIYINKNITSKYHIIFKIR